VSTAQGMDDLLALGRSFQTLLEKAERLEVEKEQLEVQLAGCSCAALGYAHHVHEGDYGWSVALTLAQTCVQGALDNLGVPDENTPSPIAQAHQLLSEWLERQERVRSSHA